MSQQTNNDENEQATLYPVIYGTLLQSWLNVVLRSAFLYLNFSFLMRYAKFSFCIFKNYFFEFWDYDYITCPFFLFSSPKPFYTAFLVLFQIQGCIGFFIERWYILYIDKSHSGQLHWKSPGAKQTFAPIMTMFFQCLIPRMPCFQAITATFYNMCFNLEAEHNKVIKSKFCKWWSFAL